MTTFVFFQGGSGSKVAQAFDHLVNVGMIGPNNIIHVQLCDKDSINKDTEDAQKLTSLVSALSKVEFLSPNSHKTYNQVNKIIFTTPLIFDMHDLSADYAKLNDFAGADSADRSMADILTDKTKRTDSILLDAFYSKKEQDMDLAVGYKGCANLGATVYGFLLENNDDIVAKVKDYLHSNKDEHIKVFIVGSIFGGTGASMFSATAELVKNLAPNLIHVAGALILPSFGFPSKENCIIDSGRFWGKTITSLQGYAKRTGLIKQSADDQEGILDRLYLAVQPNNELHFCTVNVSEGGTDQMRKSDFIDVVTAYYICDFINAETNNNFKSYCQDGCKNIYTLNYPDVNPQDPLTLDVIPGLRNSFVKMLQFSSFVFSLKYDLRVNKKSKDIDWLKKLFDIGLFEKREYAADSTEAGAVIDPVFNYCSSFVDFAMDLCDNGKATTANTGHEYQDEYNFFNVSAINLLYRVKTSMLDGNQICSQSEVNNMLNLDSFCNDKITSVMDIINNAKEEIKADKNAAVKDAVSAYMNKVYDFISSKF